MPPAVPDRPPTGDETAVAGPVAERSELSRLGLDDDMLRLYRAALRIGGTSSAELAAQVGLDPDRTERALERLSADGFLTSYGAVAPRAALRTVVVRRLAELTAREAELRTVDAMVDGLADSLWPQDARLPVADVGLVVGLPEIARLSTHIVMAAEREVLILDAPPYAQDDAAVAPSAHFNRGADADEEALDRGVTFRRILAREALDLPGRAEGIRDRVGKGMSVRVRATLPSKLILVDGTTALLPPSSTADARATALVLRGGILMHVLVPFFEMLWADSVPIAVGDDGVAPGAPGPEGSPTAEERELLTMLAAGLKDESIARQLDVHVATARRRITALLTRLGVSSRFQAGVQAARRGWLGEG
ncbi:MULTISPECIES: LuxR C-terminal-related transcriptional regulator [unclassified Isoptericola]|uniref:LuxR C-terminal-related transcriptional regulator n=1 Tax=unclassified Isoptericola TaxID=2623355 RepID=UPI00366599D9